MCPKRKIFVCLAEMLLLFLVGVAAAVDVLLEAGDNAASFDCQLMLKTNYNILQIEHKDQQKEMEKEKKKTETEGKRAPRALNQSFSPKRFFCFL